MYRKAIMTIFPGNPTDDLIPSLQRCPYVEDFQDVVIDGRRQIVVEFLAPMEFYYSFSRRCKETGIRVSTDEDFPGL